MDAQYHPSKYIGIPIKINVFEAFAEIAVKQVELRFALAKKSMQRSFISGFSNYVWKNFLKGFLIFWFVLHQGKMNK